MAYKIENGQYQNDGIAKNFDYNVLSAIGMNPNVKFYYFFHIVFIVGRICAKGR